MVMTTCVNCSHLLDEQARFCPLCGTKVGGAGDRSDPLCGRILNAKYRVLSEIGAGSMGTVYLGEHLGLKKRVALKILRPDLQISEDMLQRFQREGIAAGQFTHPYAIQIFDFDRDGRLFFLAMEYVEGQTLRQLIRSRVRVPLDTAAALCTQLLSVLAEAHRHGIVHRDLKPDNIMVTESTAGGLNLKVLDFGLSKLLDRPFDENLRTQVGRIVGTPLYMSPEQGRGEEVDHRSDLYAAGVILYEMLAGVPPFTGQTLAEILLKHSTETAPSLSESQADIPTELESVVSRALEKRREDRFQSAGEMLLALEKARRGEPVDSPPRSWGRSSRKKRRRRMLIAAAAIALVALTAWLVTGGWSRLQAGSSPTRVSEKPAAELTPEQSNYLSLLSEGRSMLRRGNVDAALAAINEAARMSCADAEVLVLRARAYREQGHADAARADLTEALRRDPKLPAALCALGWLQLDDDSLATAFEQFTAAAAQDQNSAEAQAGLGAVAYRRGELTKARELLTHAVSLDRSLGIADFYLGRTRLDLNEVDGAIDALVQAMRVEPRSWRIFSALGEAYLAAERYDDAEKQLREALSLEPDATDVREELASMLISRGRVVDAAQILEAGVERQRDAGRLRFLLATVRQSQGRVEDAVNELEEAQRLGIQDPDARSLLGILYQQQGRYPEAISQYEAALAQDGRAPLPHLNLGLALMATENYEEAASHLERAAALTPDNPLAHLSLGILYMDYLGDWARAREHFQRYGELGGNDPRVSGWLSKIGQMGG
jgi:serine/threonine protein kinase/tetratricopeptide (TPR) repeat protein